MKNRRMAVATAAAALLALATGTAAAGTSAATVTIGTATLALGTTGADVQSSKRVCTDAPAGFAACQARVATTGWALHPMASDRPTGYSPAQLNTAYGLGGISGAARGKIAIVDAFANPSAAADLDVYRKQFGLGTVKLTQMDQTGGPISSVTGNTGWGQEEMLDLDMASAICPECPIMYVGAKSASFADLSAAVNTAAAHGAKVISNSYDGAEFSGEDAYAAAYDHPGIAITVSSGDNGYGTMMPAAFNTVTAVGGTTLNLDANGERSSETAWSGAGSGCSAYISKPAWQTITACGDKRAVADVSAVADPATGVSVYDSYGSTGGNWFVIGGTSVSAPLVGGIYARTGDSEAVPASHAYTSSTSLFDVTSGSNGTCEAVGAALCTGGPGWDGPTGNGAPFSSLAPF